MERKMNKRGINVATIQNWIMGIILVVVLFKVAALLLPEAFTAGDELQQTGVPFGNFVKSGGIMWLVIMVGMFLLVLFKFMPKGGGGK